MKNLEKYKLIKFTDTTILEKKMILKWRNDERVRRWMVNKEIITLNNHLKYIGKLKFNQKKLCFLIKENKKYIGIIEFDDINLKNKIAYFGLNINMDLIGQGIGEKLIKLATEISVKKLNLSTLILYVFLENKKAINLYENNGFLIKKEQKIGNKKIYYMEKKL